MISIRAKRAAWKSTKTDGWTKKITAGVDRGGKKRTEIDETGLVIMLELK